MPKRHMEIRMRQTEDKFMLRLPDGWRQAIKERAVKNRRSMNQEILATLESVVLAATEGQIGVGSSAAAVSNNAALQCGASITR